MRYTGLGDAGAAEKAFDALRPFVAQILDLQAECEAMGPDDHALAIALDGLQTAAYHFTRRRFFYLDMERPARHAGNGRLCDRTERIKAMEALAPYRNAIRALQGKCPPQRRDWLALDIARQALDTTAFHFTREEHFWAGALPGQTPRPPRY